MNYLGFSTHGGSNSTSDLLNVSTDIVPNATELFDVGRPAKRFRNGEYVKLLADSFVKNGGLSTQFLMADGSVTTSSSGNQGSNIYLYKNSTLLAGTPAVSYLRYNFANQASATEVVISYQARYGIDIDAFLSLIDPSSIIYIQEYSNAANYIKYAVTSAITTPNVSTTCTVTFLQAEGTGLTSFGEDTPIFMSIFVDSASIDNRLTSLEANGAILNTKTQNQTAVSGTTNFGNKLLVYEVDTPTTAPLVFGIDAANSVQIGNDFITTRINGKLSVNNIDSSGLLDIGTVGATILTIGKAGVGVRFPGTVQSQNFDTVTTVPMNIGATNANQITIGQPTSLTSISGTSCNILTRLNTPLLDRLTFGQLSIGTTNSSSIEIGNSTIVTSIIGSSTDILTRLNTPWLDRVTVGQLSIGTSTNSSSISIGNGTIVTTINGASTNIGARLNAPNIDRATVGQMFIGNATASGITLGGGGIITSVAGNGLNVTIRITCPVYDTVSGTAMTIGTTNQTGLTIGRPNITTSIRGSPLTSDSNIVNFTTCIPTIAANSKLICSRYVMAGTSVATNTGVQNLSPGYGNLSYNLGDNFTTFIVGATLRITGIGYLTSMAAGSTLGVIMNYGPTSNIAQDLFNVLFANATSNGVFSFQVNIQILTTGTITNPLINGTVTYTDGTATVTKPILNTVWTMPVNTQAVNTLSFVTIFTGSVSYGINSFMVDNIR